jgi:hypothetical protein
LGNRDSTTFEKGVTTIPSQYVRPFMKTAGKYILTHDFESLDVLTVEDGIPTNIIMGRMQGFSLIVDSDIEILGEDVWVIINDLTTMIKVFKVEGSQIV